MRVQTVTELTASIKQVIEQGFAHIEVQGEVSRLTRPSSGHLYFTIKDSHAAISAVVWRSSALRLHAQLKEGQAFVFAGHLSVYEPRGTYQMMVTRIMPVGAGALAAEFEARKSLFAQRGWFASEHKQALPTLPQHIGIVTSTTAAAWEDVKKVLATRPAYLQLTLSPCIVQGQQAPDRIVSALQYLQDLDSRPDVILLVRGGGSLEDLWCFNDERVVQAVFACDIPVVSGVGHEIDTTLVDYAADVRAATPSNAAELCCPSRDSLRQRLPAISRIKQGVRSHLTHGKQQWMMQQQHLHHQQERWLDQRFYQHDQCAERLTSSMTAQLRQHQRGLQALQVRLQHLEPSHRLRHEQQNLHQCQVRLSKILPHILDAHQAWQRLYDRLQQAVQRIQQEKSNRWLRMYESLKALDPKHVLQRGYSLTYDRQGNMVTQVQGLKKNNGLKIYFGDGHLDVYIDVIHKQSG
ncbi:MAG: exodeoxyribonuclease VII large subunit [Zetaproteobacteria bacterium]|nr:exodeoxyribonuclease VII large subunit [Zetaproteobacteria bacterium]